MAVTYRPGDEAKPATLLVDPNPQAFYLLGQARATLEMLAGSQDLLPEHKAQIDRLVINMKHLEGKVFEFQG
jgi:hypothetical protein